MKKANPYWYKLIKHLKAKGKIKTGPTIPYLFGAYEILGLPFSNISDLLIEVQETVIDKFPLIQKCSVIRKHVLMVENKNVCNRYYKKCVKLPNSRNDNYLFISTNTKLGDKLEKVSFNLESLYWEYIKNKTYNWDKNIKDWIKFTNEDKELILNIKKRL